MKEVESFVAVFEALRYRLIRKSSSRHCVPFHSIYVSARTRLGIHEGGSEDEEVEIGGEREGEEVQLLLLLLKEL